MLSLKGRHIFLISKIVRKMDLKNKLPKTINVTGMTDEEKLLIQEDIGKQFLFMVIENLYLAEQEIIELLAQCSLKTYEEISELSFNELVEMIKELFSSEDFQSFFK